MIDSSGGIETARDGQADIIIVASSAMARRSPPSSRNAQATRTLPIAVMTEILYPRQRQAQRGHRAHFRLAVLDQPDDLGMGWRILSARARTSK